VFPEAKFFGSKAPAGRVRSGFMLGEHELVEIQLPGEVLRPEGNTLAFEMPHYPQEDDPYVYIYDLEANVSFA
jgi:hypothetical protein